MKYDRWKCPLRQYRCKRDFIQKIHGRQAERVRKKGNVVMDGRDIGSVVFPDATIKFFIEASMEVEPNEGLLNSRKMLMFLYQMYFQYRKRDHIDSSRDDSPLVIPENAIVLTNNEDGLSHLLEVAISKIDSLNQ